MNHNTQTQVHRLRLLLTGALLVITGLTIGIFSTSLPDESNHTLIALLGWLSDLFIFTGGLGIVIDVFMARQKAAADRETLGLTFDQKIPQIADAVLRALGDSKHHLEGIASPELLDGIATNALSLRLGDDQFAREIYTDVRDQAIRAPERWHDVDVSIRLSATASRSASGAALFDQLIEWEYTTVLSHSVRKFTCTSDRDEFYDLVTEVPATSVWFMPEHASLDASAASSFELVEFTVDGTPMKIRRTTKQLGQTYVVRIPDELHNTLEPVRVRAVYRALGARDSHRLFIEAPVPCRDLSITLDYTDTDIARMSVTDAVTSLAKPRVSRIPERLAGKEITVDLPGWLLPRSGFTYVWALNSELTRQSEESSAKAA